jgi:surface protein
MKPNLRLLIIGCIILIIGYIVLKKLSNKEEQFFYNKSVDAYVHKNKHDPNQPYIGIYTEPKSGVRLVERDLTLDERVNNYGTHIRNKYYIKVLYDPTEDQIKVHPDQKKATNLSLSCFGRPPGLSRGLVGCKGAAWSGGKGSKTYCEGKHWDTGDKITYPWYKKCCKWINGSMCVPDPDALLAEDRSATRRRRNINRADAAGRAPCEEANADLKYKDNDPQYCMSCNKNGNCDECKTHLGMTQGKTPNRHKCVGNNIPDGQPCAYTWQCRNRSSGVKCIGYQRPGPTSKDAVGGTCVHPKRLRIRKGWKRVGGILQPKHNDHFKKAISVAKQNNWTIPQEALKQHWREWELIDTDSPLVNSDGSHISNWDTSDVTDMSEAFKDSTFNQDISKWNTHKVTNMRSMFERATKFNQDISKWKVQKVTNMENMFKQASAFTGGATEDTSIAKWKPKKLMKMRNMFTHAGAFNINLCSWKNHNSSLNLPGPCKVEVLKLKDNRSFKNAISSLVLYGAGADPDERERKLGLGKQWEINSNTDQGHKVGNEYGEWVLKYINNNENGGHISNWDTSNVTDMSETFFTPIRPVYHFSHQNLRNFNEDISAWDTSNVRNMKKMFKNNVKFNQKISYWDTSKVTNMNQMFMNTLEFNQNISSWNIKNVINGKNAGKNTKKFTARNCGAVCRM